jgi:hypothetical protein
MNRTSFAFTFFCLLSLSSCAPQPEKVDCSKFRKGRFLYHSEYDHSTTTIERNDSIQTETKNESGYFLKMKIRWTSDCDYELTFLDEIKTPTDSAPDYFKMHPLNTKILRSTSNYYIFESKMEGIPQSLIDTLIVLRAVSN